MTPVRLLAAAAATAAAALGVTACTGSSTSGEGTLGTTRSAGGATTTTTTTAPTTATESVVPTTSPPTPPPTGGFTRSTGASTDTALSSSPAPTGRLTCGGLATNASIRRIARFHAGGSLPSGVPLPQAVPSLTCAGTAAGGVGIVAVSWTSVAQTQYGVQLQAVGWKRTAANGLEVYRKKGAPKAIVLATVSGQLVGLYGPPE